MGEYAIDVNESNFDEAVLRSRLPVVVDFWAAWCGPCKVLKPMLEKLAEEAGGRFVLAKVNSEENPNLSRRYNVRSIPDVRVFIGGEIVDGFMGALPESEIRGFLDRTIPSPSEELRRKAMHLDPDAARALLIEALRMDPENGVARLDLAEALLKTGAIEPAKELIRALGSDHSQGIERIRAKIAFMEAGAAFPDESELRREIEADPGNPEYRIRIATLYASKQDFDAALAVLLEVVQLDRKNDEARKMMLSLFELASDQPELVSRYRRSLASALY